MFNLVYLLESASMFGSFLNFRLLHQHDRYAREHYLDRQPG
jgi:hypothetical protein